MPKKVGLLRERFKNQPFVCEYDMKLVFINKKRAIVTMPVYDGMWTSGGIANGLTLGPVANAAGVFLAMMNSEHFTPLVRVKELVYIRSTKKGIDKNLVAEATVIETVKRKFKRGNQSVMLISVEVKGSDGRVKTKGIFEYLLPDKEY